MKAIKIKYTLKNGNTMVVGIIADNREQAVKTLLDRQKNVKNLVQVEIGMDLHIMTNSIKYTLLQGKEEIKKLKTELQHLKSCLMTADDDIEILRSSKANVSNDTRYVKEIEMLHEKIVQMEIDKPNSSKQIDTKKYTDEIEKLKAEISTLKTDIEIHKAESLDLTKLHDESQVEMEKLKKTQGFDKFICPECLKSFKSPKGVKLHFNKMHKEGFNE